MIFSAKLVDEGCDWMRCTSDAPTVAAIWRKIVAVIIGNRSLADDILQAGRRLGYRGIMGPGAFYGSRRDGSMIDLSGIVARDVGFPALVYGGKATRIDMQTTIRTSVPPPCVLSQHFEELRSAPRKRGLPIDVEMRVGLSGPRAITIGRRSSEFFARIYDKHQESKQEEYESCLRYEVEYKGKAAERLGQVLRESYDKPEVVRNQSIGWFLTKGLCVPDICSSTPSVNKAARPATTLEAKRAWLNRQVRPTVAKLVDVVGLLPTIADLLPDNVSPAEAQAIIFSLWKERQG